MASDSRLHSKRSFTGNHTLLPAVRPRVPISEFTQQPAYSLLAWTFGRGSVIWRIWPAVILHTCFAAIIVVLYEVVLEDGDKDWISIPNVMLTVLGVVIGFVISYRAMSGYDRYWMGRTVWSDVIRNARTMSRLVWFHVPPRLTPKTSQETDSGQVDRSREELLKVMAEKRLALDLVEGFAVALKHHIRGEVGIYYEDLYDLVRPLHDHDHTPEQKAKAAAVSTAVSPNKARRIASQPSIPQPRPSSSKTSSGTNTEHFGDPVIPPINAYGTFQPSRTPSRQSLRHNARRSPSSGSGGSHHQTLQPSQRPSGEGNMMNQVSGELIPFAGMFNSIRNWFKSKRGYEPIGGDAHKDPLAIGASQRKWGAPLQPRVGSSKHRVRVSPNGENLPVEILRCLSEWCSVLEDRNTVPGTSLGGMVGCIAAMEETLSALERILTTPLPFVYSVHIRHTVWIYLFFLPFQLVAEFSWYTIPGVSIAAFIYLGFLAAGEEIEQPFGYDENDLDLDMFCQEIIHVDIQNLKKSPCLNAYIPQHPQLIHHRSMTLTEITAQASESDDEDLGQVEVLSPST